MENSPKGHYAIYFSDPGSLEAEVADLTKQLTTVQNEKAELQKALHNHDSKKKKLIMKYRRFQKSGALI